MEKQPVKYIKFNDEEQLQALNRHALFHNHEWKSLEDIRYCCHCDKSFTGRQVKFWKSGLTREQGGMEDGLWAECGTEGCDGSPLDWSLKPWNLEIKEEDETMDI
jgi:hypothetical protein